MPGPCLTPFGRRTEATPQATAEAGFRDKALLGSVAVAVAVAVLILFRYLSNGWWMTVVLGSATGLQPF